VIEIKIEELIMKVLNINNKLQKLLIGSCVVMLSNIAFAGWIDDASITAAIKAKYLAHPAMSVWDIGVETTDGHVKLSGYANSNTQLDAAISIASDTEGVEDVNVDNLDVERSKHPAKDVKITTKVNYELIKSKILDEEQPNPLKISVETVNANVYLFGKVKNWEQESAAVNVAQNVKEVKSVTSFLDKYK
jgi:hyperosmotically inducible protein